MVGISGNIINNIYDDMKYNTQTYNIKLKELDRKFKCIDNYINNKTKISHLCLLCDNISKIRPDHLLHYGRKCEKCMSNSGFKLDNEKYDDIISNTSLIRIGDYLNNLTSIKHQCKLCDKFLNIIPKSVKNGSKCLCNRSENSNKWNHNKYLNELKIRKIKYHPIGGYKTINNPLLHKCIDCNREWEIKPSSILNGSDCICKTRLSREDYINRLPNNIKLIGEFKGTSHTTKHKCIDCDNEWGTKPNYILHMGTGCNNCTSSKGERKVKEILDKNNIKYIREKVFKNLPKFRFDFYLTDYNIIIEYDGVQHSKPVEFFGGDKYFEKVKINDNIKNNYCIDNNIKLIRIPYNKFNVISKSVGVLLEKIL